MFYARYLVAETADTWDRVDANEYDVDVHGTNLRCGHPVCESQVRFRNCESSYAGSASRSDHFYSVDRSEHIENCPCLTEAHDVDALSISKREALEVHYPILLNMNFFMGDSHYNQFSSSRDAGQVQSRYNDFRVRHSRHYARESIRSLSQYFAEVGNLRKRDPEGLSPIIVGHCHDIRRNENFAINGHKGRLRMLYNAMSERAQEQANGSDVIVHEFPRVVSMRPTKEEAKNPYKKGKELRCNPIKLSPENYKNGLVVLNVLQFSDPALRPEFMRHSHNYVVARPSLSSAEIRLAKMAFDRGENGFIRLFWDVDSADQFMPAPDATVTPEPPPRQLALI